ncbi:ABC transporter ATP-binding protein [Lacticigenium naphthae]|uniref:ABC transporter ATP-binding protein n=1 Tax=Lacticigenium naphthae TaxID=515351 RepID=UPI0004206F2E|nr:ABC transporter ATP-binding protein [Lacticigenium naphthae]
MLKVQQISKSYKGRTVLKEIDFDAERGTIIGLVAPNGTGKTTLLQIIMNFVVPDAGQIVLDDQYNYRTKQSTVEMYRHISFLPELDDVYEELSGRDHLKLYARMWNKTDRSVNGIVEQLNMESYIKRPVKTYSLGMRQRMCFAMLLAADTDIMLMDEVMNGLDPDNVQLITDQLLALKEQGKTILIASHLLENLDIYADRILFLKEGDIIADVPAAEKRETFIKIYATREEIKKLKADKHWRWEAELEADQLYAIPLKDMEPEETSSILTYLIQEGYSRVSLGEIGTMELYASYYGV